LHLLGHVVWAWQKVENPGRYLGHSCTPHIQTPGRYLEHSYSQLLLSFFLNLVPGAFAPTCIFGVLEHTTCFFKFADHFAAPFFEFRVREFCPWADSTSPGTTNAVLKPCKFQFVMSSIERLDGPSFESGQG